MNLNAIANGVTKTVTPNIIGTIVQSVGGYTTQPDGTQVPNYNTILGVEMQVQAVTGKELKQVDSLNIQGEKRAVWINGNWLGEVQAKGKGGDFLQFLGQTWLVIVVDESWDTPGWTHCVVALQKDPPA